MAVRRIHLVIQPYFATEIQEWERDISRKRASIVAANQEIIFLIGCHDSSLVIDNFCVETAEGDPTVWCFYFDFAARRE